MARRVNSLAVQLAVGVSYHYDPITLVFFVSLIAFVALYHFIVEYSAFTMLFPLRKKNPSQLVSSECTLYRQIAFTIYIFFPLMIVTQQNCGDSQKCKRKNTKEEDRGKEREREKKTKRNIGLRFFDFMCYIINSKHSHAYVPTDMQFLIHFCVAAHTVLERNA